VKLSPNSPTTAGAPPPPPKIYKIFHCHHISTRYEEKIFLSIPHKNPTQAFIWKFENCECSNFKENISSQNIFIRASFDSSAGRAEDCRIFLFILLNNLNKDLAYSGYFNLTCFSLHFFEHLKKCSSFLFLFSYEKK
jgi:hypothetical protein